MAALLALGACERAADPEPTEAARSAPPAVRYDQHGAAGNIEPAAADLVNPFAGDPEAARQGELLFAAMNCDGCHGGGGAGFAAPSLVDGRWRYGSEPGALFHSIFYGRPQGMPAYGGILPDATIWQLVTYVQAQPPPDVVPTLAWR